MYEFKCICVIFMRGEGGGFFKEDNLIKVIYFILII